MSGIIIAGTNSGVGKTTITVGLIAALRRLGRSVQPFKVGPDYIDPTFHTLCAGRPCCNLDTWLVPSSKIGLLYAGAMDGVDCAVIEGVMGLFDGQGYEDETGSTAQIAKLLGLPVILVIDAAKMARSAIALARGFQHFDPEVNLAGFIVNRVGSANHGRGVSAALAKATGLPVLGWVPRDDRLRIEERHLGLVPAVEPGRWEEFLAGAEEIVRSQLDLDQLQNIARTSPLVSRVSEQRPGKSVSQPQFPKPCIAVARDEAFHFTYEENLALLEAAGAEIVFFSPLRDTALPLETAGILLSGGFPEMFAADLARNSSMLESIRNAQRRNLPMYAECGGLMYLTEAIVDGKGNSHGMAGLLPGRSRLAGRATLGYWQARAAGTSWLFDAGEEIHGHEFHYSLWEDRPANLPPCYFLLPANGTGEPWPEGARQGNLWASYVHLHFWGKPELATRFVNACRQVGAKQKAGTP